MEVDGPRFKRYTPYNILYQPEFFKRHILHSIFYQPEFFKWQAPYNILYQFGILNGTPHIISSTSQYFSNGTPYIISTKKGSVVPLRSIEALLGGRRYSCYSFLIWALEGGEWSASRPGRALPPGKEPPVPTVQEAGWVPEPVWAQRLEEKSSACVGDRTPAVQSVVRHCTD
jgi:hypothetical protein